jgi:hypothetical protein
MDLKDGFKIASEAIERKLDTFLDEQRDNAVRNHIESTIREDTVQIDLSQETLYLFLKENDQHSVVGKIVQLGGADWSVDKFRELSGTYTLKRILPKIKEPTNPVLLFVNPVFNHGVNLTVRRGVKWDALLDKSKVDIVDVVSGTLYGTTSINTRVFLFEDLENADLTFEHDPKSRTYGGLLRDMKATYNGFDVREIVTLVYFEMP